MEAMAVGTPVVAARMGSIPDVVTDGETGLLVPPGDAHAMACAVREVLDDPELASRLVRAGRQHVEQHFDCRRHQQVVATECRRLEAGIATPVTSAPVGA
jgi:glycosyltransferase involved in cell wall biosynthesis